MDLRSAEVVVVEAAACLLAEPPFLDVSAEQGERSFRRVSFRGRVVFLDVENDIQSDFVHQSKRRLGRAQNRLENTIHVLGGGDAVRNDRKRLPLDSGPNPVENEANALTLDVIGFQTKSWQDVHQSFYDFRPGRAARHQFDGVLQRRHIKVSIEYALGARQRPNELAGGK